MVTTLAGKTGAVGSVDGRGAAARSPAPDGIACDAAGNLYVTEFDGDTILKITPDGVVTTLAGAAPAAGNQVDGTGAAATFNQPTGIAGRYLRQRLRGRL